MKKSYEKHMEKKKMLAGKRIVGIDPAKEKHQAAVLNEEGIQMGRSFSFPVSHEGYSEKLWKEIGKILGDYGTEDLAFAVETSCALWKTLTDYLSQRGYTVLMVNPLTTYHSRPLMNHDFSKTDPKDALLIATNARNGNYTVYQHFTPEINKLHRLSITYDKLTKDRQKAIARLRAFMEEVFPEFLNCIPVDIETSLYLLDRYFLPEHFGSLSVHEEELNVRRISNGNHGAETLRKLKEYAQKSIGSSVYGEEDALRLTLDIWIMQVRQTGSAPAALAKAMIELARKTEYFEILTSLKGISDISAARFIAECRDLSLYEHYKQIEKHAGANLRLMDSGKYQGARRISGIGNKRLLKLIYLMTTQTARFIPEVRIKFIKRQIKKKCYRKNIIASSSQLLKLLMALIKERRPYAFREEAAQELEKLEMKYSEIQNTQKKEANRKAA
jgi:transposase